MLSETTPQRNDLRPSAVSPRGTATLWVAALAMFAAIHSPPDRIMSLGLVRHILALLPGAEPAVFSHFVVAPMRGALFIPSATYLLYVLAREVRSRLSVTRTDVRIALLLFAALSILAVPFRPPFGVISMGYHYGRMSVAPFHTGSGWFYRRLLVPALGHVTGLSGPVYILLGTALTFCLVLLVQYATRRALGSGDRLAPVIALSICTSSFVLFSFQSPGYPDAAFLSLALLLGLFAFDLRAVIAAVALALAAHEVAAFILVPILIFRYTSAARRAGLAVLACYCLMMALSFRLDAVAVLQSQTIVQEKSSFQYLADQPLLAAFGAAISLKLLWPFVIALIANSRIGWRARGEVAAYVVASLASLPFAVDTSRLVGFSAVGLLFHLGAYARASESTRVAALFRAACIVNIFVPAVYVGLNVGPRATPGLYRLMWRAGVSLFN